MKRMRKMTPISYLTDKDILTKQADTLLASRCVELIGKTLNFEQIPLSAEGHILPLRNIAANVNSSNALRTISISCRSHRMWGRHGISLTDGLQFSHHIPKGSTAVTC